MTGLKNRLGDIRLREDVLAELEWDPRIDPSQLHVRVNDGVVSLGGTVTTHSQRRAAVRAAGRVGGVKAVADDIEVVLSRDIKRADSELAAAIVRERTRNAALPDTVEVEVRSGEVILCGYVSRAEQREEAERAVRRLPGVRGVANAIDVRPQPA
jgi:osmotically-inducible protein OsmY